MKDILNEIGFYKIENNLEELVNQSKNLFKNAGNKDINSFESLPSFLSSEYKDTSHNTLVIDIGGTSTKAAIYYKKKWIFLFEIRNLDLKSIKEANSFILFLEILAQQVYFALIHKNIRRREVQACTIVWSNTIENYRLNEKTISGKITGRDLYQKNEWFIRDLKDGDDIGKMFLDTFKENYSIENFAITNDTPLTMKAFPNSNAGVVASTGLNATIINSENIICNAEMGSRFLLNKELLTICDTITNLSSIERLSSGKFLPKLFISYIKHLDIFSNLAKNILFKKDSIFRAKDLSLLLYDQKTFLQRRENPKLYSAKDLVLLKDLASEIFKRAAKLCSLVINASVMGQKRDVFSVALDSRLAREVPLFLDTLIQTTKQINANIKIELIQPIRLSNGSISAPMIGGIQCF